MSTSRFSFVDLFSGCGGLSLGLMNAGWHGIFAIEQSPDAFKTLMHNLIEEGEHNAGNPRFSWPGWLEKESHEVAEFVRTQRQRLVEMSGEVQLVAGGPPCRGFSFAGKRTGKDPRNELFRHHLEVVDILRSELVLLENVQGIGTAFGAGKKPRKKRRGRPRKSYANRIREALEEHGCEVQQHVLKAADFGVPQFRPRYFTLGIREDLLRGIDEPDLQEVLAKMRNGFLKHRGLPVRRPVADAISDLTIDGKEPVECADEESPPRFKEIVCQGSEARYQKLMHAGMNGRVPNSLRLVNHRPETIQRFQKIPCTCRKGVQLSEEDSACLGIRKTAIAPLAPDKPSHTLTTLPDDFLHYAELRIHTVCEHARLQSFPDWFEFRGKYTTGGDRRAKECPRYTQVRNAVPPLLAEAIGLWKRRALTLKQLATVMAKRNGRFPRTRAEVEALPGVGQYITNAILLLCHGEAQPLLDANMARVLERVFGPRKLADIRYDPYLQDLAFEVVQCKEAKELSWAILDLAASKCLPRKPHCTTCPLEALCLRVHNTIKEVYSR